MSNSIFIVEFYRMQLRWTLIILLQVGFIINSELCTTYMHVMKKSLPALIDIKEGTGYHISYCRIHNTTQETESKDSVYCEIAITPQSVQTTSVDRSLLQ